MSERTPEEIAREIVEKWIGSPARDEVCGLLAGEISSALTAERSAREAAERERDALRMMNDPDAGQKSLLIRRCESAESEVAELRSKLGRAAEAIRPFAEHLDARLINGQLVRDYHADEGDSVPMFRNITVGDFRRAARVLKEIRP